MARQIRHSDRSGKRLFSHRRVVAGLVRLLGDPWVDDLDFDRLERLPAEHVTDDLRARRADLPWWALQAQCRLAHRRRSDVPR